MYCYFIVWPVWLLGWLAPGYGLLQIVFQDLTSNKSKAHSSDFIASTYIVHPSFYSEPLLKANYISTILKLDKSMMMMMMVMIVRQDNNENEDVIIRN